jgi:hypothetical protein
MLADRDYARFARTYWRDYGERLAAIWAADPGNMPYGRYRGQPVAVMLRDPDYVRYLENRWQFGIPDPPEMIAAIRHLTRRPETIRVYREQGGGCVVYRPAAWRRGVVDDPQLCRAPARLSTATGCVT